MSDDLLPAPGGKLTSESFANLALVAAEFCSGVTLVLTAMDDQDSQVGELFVIEDVPADSQGRAETLDRLLSKRFGCTRTVRLRIAYAFVEEVAPGIVTVQVFIRNVYRIDGLN
jgi:hypothetical protein